MKNKLSLHSCILKCVNYGLLPSLLMNIINKTFSKQHSTTLPFTPQHFKSWSTYLVGTLGYQEAFIAIQ